MKDLEPFLVEERLSEGWEPRAMSRKGLTILALNASTVIKVESMTEKRVVDAER